MGPILCNKCDLRNSCLKLCSAAKEYVSQDHKGKNSRRERFFSHQGIKAAMDRSSFLAYIRASKAGPRVISIDLSPLTDRQRQCIEMVFSEGLTFRHIGERLGISHVSAIKHLRRAMTKLRGLPNAIIFEGEN